jgi:hypothetical protein
VGDGPDAAIPVRVGVDPAAPADPGGVREAATRAAARKNAETGEAGGEARVRAGEAGGVEAVGGAAAEAPAAASPAAADPPDPGVLPARLDAAHGRESCTGVAAGGSAAANAAADRVAADATASLAAHGGDTGFLGPLQPPREGVASARTKASTSA